MTISEWLHDSKSKFTQAGIDSALIDAEIILAHTLRKSRTYLHSHNEDTISDRLIAIADARKALRLDRIPVAYIIGHKEFYGRRFDVSTSVLIPRPESEIIIELLGIYEKSRHQERGRLVDIGTGSGCLGITAKLEHPDLSVILTDIDVNALAVAEANASRLAADVRIAKGDLLSGAPGRFNYILANLPYVDKSWNCSPETQAEPSIALFADDNGLVLIKKLLDQAGTSLSVDGVIFIEADPRQHPSIIEYAKTSSLALDTHQGYILAFKLAPQDVASV